MKCLTAASAFTFIALCGCVTMHDDADWSPPSFTPPPHWRQQAPREQIWQVMTLSSKAIICWEVEASICEFGVESTDPAKEFRKVEGTGLPDVFEVLDEKLSNGWKLHLMQVRGTRDIYIQIIGLKRDVGTICNFRLRGLAGRSGAEAAREVSRLDRELVRVAQALGWKAHSIVHVDGDLLRIGNSWGVLLATREEDLRRSKSP